MNNNQRSLIRRIVGYSIAVPFFLFLVVLAGIQLSFFNNYNPFYNSTELITACFVMYISRNRLKDKKETSTILGFFDNTGHSEVWDIEKTDEDSTHIKFDDGKGEIQSIKHAHPFLIPTDDGYERLYLAPRKGKLSLSPQKLFDKYGNTITEEQRKKITELRDYIISIGINDIETLNPDLLVKDMTEADEADTLMEEFAHHLSEIRRAVAQTLGLRANLFSYIMIGGTAGLLTLLGLMIAHADFSHIGF